MKAAPNKAFQSAPNIPRRFTNAFGMFSPKASPYLVPLN